MNGSTVLLSNIQSRLLFLLFFIFYFLLSTSPYLCSVVTVSIYLVSCRNFNINRVVLGGTINPQELLLSRFFLFFVDFFFFFYSVFLLPSSPSALVFFLRTLQPLSGCFSRSSLSSPHSIYSILVSVDRVPRLRDKFAGTSTWAQKACSTLGRF